MLTSPSRPLSVARAGTAPLSKGQKTFNALIKQIEQARKRLAEWETTIPRYQQKYAAELQPLIDDAQALELKTVQALDQAHGQKGFTETERRKMASVIAELAYDLLAARDDPALKAIYNEYSDFDYDDETAADQALLKDAVEQMFGFDLGEDIDLKSPERFMQQAEAKIREQQTLENAAHQAREAAQAKRKKSPKQLAREAREQADEQQLKQSIRDIYRKLASALHPDRETDPQERERKTALMQKLNQAYDKNNLLQLLELQLELEQIDQAHLNNVSEDRLKHYNKILREQLTELQHEILRVESGFTAQFMFDPFEALNPDTILRHLDTDIVNIKIDIRKMQNDLLAFEDIKTLKAWLKRMRLPSRRDAFDDFRF